MRCLVFAFAMIFVGCSTYSHLGSGGPGGPRDSRGTSVPTDSETTVIWLDSQGRFPSVGFFDVQTIFDEIELGPGSYVRVAALHVTGTSRKALVGMLRLRASQIGANRLLIVKVEEKKEEVSLYSGTDNVSRFFFGEKTDADQRNEAYALRIDAIAIRQSDDLSTVYRIRPEDVLPTVYRPRRAYDRPSVYRYPRRDDRRTVYRPPRRDNRSAVKHPPRRDNRPPVRPPPPREDRSPAPPPKEDRSPTPPPPRDEPSTVKPPPPPPEDDRPSRLKRPRLKTHRP